MSPACYVDLTFPRPAIPHTQVPLLSPGLDPGLLPFQSLQCSGLWAGRDKEGKRNLTLSNWCDGHFSPSFISFYITRDKFASQLAQWVKNLPAMQETQVTRGSIPGSGRSPGGGHGNPHQYSCLENPVDRRAWRTTVHRVTVRHNCSDWARTHSNSSSRLSSPQNATHTCFSRYTTHRAPFSI